MKYSKGKVNLMLGDCMDLMASKPDNYYDLGIIDPPYNIVSQQKRGIGSRIDKSGKMNNWNNAKPDKKYFDELFRITKYQIIWGANNFELPPTEYFIIWDKFQTVNNFASAEYAWTNIKQPAKVFRYSIHKHNNQKGNKIHPTMKPVKLYAWILHNYAKPEFKILDTHGGSMSSGIAGYYFLNDEGLMDIIELDKDYYNDAVKRFKAQTMQTKMF